MSTRKEISSGADSCREVTLLKFCQDSDLVFREPSTFRGHNQLVFHLIGSANDCDAHAIEAIYRIEYTLNIGVLLLTISREGIRYVPIVNRIDVAVVRMFRSHWPIDDNRNGLADIVGCLHMKRPITRSDGCGRLGRRVRRDVRGDGKYLLLPSHIFIPSSPARPISRSPHGF